MPPRNFTANTDDTRPTRTRQMRRAGGARAPAASQGGVASTRVGPALAASQRIGHRLRPVQATERADPPPPPPPPASPPPPPPPLSSLPADPVAVVQWGGTLPSRRRFILGTTAGAAVALGGNLFGVTSALLSSSPSTAAAARRARLDVVFPVGGQLRCFDERERFEFAYPRSWMGDATLARRRAEKQERERMAELERASGLPSLRQRPPGGGGASSAAAAPPAVEPVAAFGPPGSTGEENVSVVVAPIMPGFSLEQLGSPADAANTFLGRTVAPPGSGRTAELFAASAGLRPQGDPSVQYYSFEFGVRSPTFERRNVSVLAVRGDRLYTLNTQAPAALWARDGALLRRTAESFVLF